MGKTKTWKELKQLDRIEYFLLNKERKNYTLVTFSMIYLFMQIVILILLFGILFIGFFGDVSFLRSAIIMLPIMRAVIIFCIIMDIVQIWISWKKKLKLDERFGL